MLENILKALQCGNISLRPYVVMADETEMPLEYTVSVNESAKNCTISATDGIVRDYLFLEYDGDEITCRRKFENNSQRTVAIKELGVELKGITFGEKPRDDYFYHNENPRIFETMTFPIDYNRTAEDAKDSEFDIQAGNRWADPGVVSERIGASPYQPFPAIIISNYQTKKGLVHGTLCQKVFFHNYLAKHEDDTVTLQVLSSFKGTHRLNMHQHRVLIDEWYLGATDEAHDIEKIFEKYTKVLRTRLPANYGASSLNRDNLVWGTWNGGIWRAINEDLIFREAKYLKENFPTMRWIQIDDGYHAYPRDARGISVPYEGPAGVHQEKFPLGLRHLTDGIREIGLRPAVWIGLKVPRDTKMFIDKEADGWFLDYSNRLGKKSFGILDVSRPEIREYMEHAVNVLCREYGFEAVKHDFWSYAFEASDDLKYTNRDKSGYEYRAWWLKMIRDAISDDGYLQTGCDIVMGNPFLGQYFTNYRYGIDIGGGNWDYVKTNYQWGVACFATHTGDLFVPNSDAVGVFSKLSDDECFFLTNYCLVTHTMVEIAGKLSQEPESERLRQLKKACCNPNNCQDVYFVGYDYRYPVYSVPEIMYFKTPHFSVEENNPVIPLRTVGLFNLEDEAKTLGFKVTDLGLEEGEYVFTDVWGGQQYTGSEFSAEINKHGSRLIAVTKAGGLKLYDANVRVNSAKVQDNVMTLEIDYAYKTAELTFSAAPKSISCDGNELAFTVENGVTKLAVPGKTRLTVTF
ncbi:MAG: alpha-galactosidase [Oscillospiraceae bacterium]|nr:alpha-galactosidase [Oscillospiraceae bacterium]